MTNLVPQVWGEIAYRVTGWPPLLPWEIVFYPPPAKQNPIVWDVVGTMERLHKLLRGEKNP